ncbi:oral cancer-overexpressed protein 1 [Alligator sinensis]|uniref:Oral cancer-overexpressed protein 1 n=1 Tax=Alligator sinensis TaxID=38654 RepID=A0A3Q0G727_ALLSI|nr:oral cancer-overexpressed protein 1 [Alligator sinensis]
MAKGIKTVMLKEIVLVLLKEGSMDRYMGPGLGLRFWKLCSKMCLLSRLTAVSATHCLVGCYLGFALTWQHLLHNCTGEKHSKKLKALESLVGMIQKFPYEDPTYNKLQDDLEKIRGKFKQVCSMLNTQPDFRIGLERSVLTF